MSEGDRKLAQELTLTVSNSVFENFDEQANSATCHGTLTISSGAYRQSTLVEFEIAPDPNGGTVAYTVSDDASVQQSLHAAIAALRPRNPDVTYSKKVVST